MKNPIVLYTQKGMTLLEILVVVTILAAVSFIGTVAFDNTYDVTHVRIAHSEMQEIAKAIKQFKADTGYYPGQGPFALLEDTSGGGLVCADDAPTSKGAISNTSSFSSYSPSNETELTTWFESPANLIQLFQAPEICTEHPFANAVTLDGNTITWNVVTGRGWRGPYLTRHLEFVDIGDDLQTDGTGDPFSVSPDRLEYVRAIADPFKHYPVTPGSSSRCKEEDNNNEPCLMDWWPLPYDGNPDTETDKPFESYGRPYLYFISEEDVSPVNGVSDVVDNIEGCNAVPCLVSLGPNGRYLDIAPYKQDNIILNIE